MTGGGAAPPDRPNKKGSPTAPFFVGPRPVGAVVGDSRCQTLKLDPQPQVVVALGFLITNCAPSKSSL